MAEVRFYNVYRAIARGKPDSRLDNLGQRILHALWIVFTQRSVFKTRPLVSILHAMIFYGFVFYFLVNLVDVIEGFTSFNARGGAWGPFNLLADLLTAGVLIGNDRSNNSSVLCSSEGLCFPCPTFPCKLRFVLGFCVIPRLWQASSFFMSAAGSCSRQHSWLAMARDAFHPVSSLVRRLFSGNESRHSSRV